MPQYMPSNFFLVATETSPHSRNKCYYKHEKYNTEPNYHNEAIVMNSFEDAIISIIHGHELRHTFDSTQSKRHALPIKYNKRGIGTN